MDENERIMDSEFIHLPFGIFLCGTDEEEEELDFTIQTHVHQDDDDDEKNCQRYEKKDGNFFFCSKLIGYTTVLCSKRKITVCMCVCQSGMIIQIELDTFFSLSLTIVK